MPLSNHKELKILYFEEISYLTMVVLKIFNALIGAAHVYTVESRILHEKCVYFTFTLHMGAEFQVCFEK